MIQKRIIKEAQYAISEMEHARTRGGLRPDFKKFKLAKNRNVSSILGLLKLEGKKTVMTWSSEGHGFIGEQRFEEYDLVLSPSHVH